MALSPDQQTIIDHVRQLDPGLADKLTAEMEQMNKGLDAASIPDLTPEEQTASFYKAVRGANARHHTRQVRLQDERQRQTTVAAYAREGEEARKAKAQSL